MKQGAMNNHACTRDFYLGVRGAERDGSEALFRTAVASWTRRYQLTTIEASILADGVHGFDRSEIAKGRILSLETVKTHIRNLLRKTGDRGLGQAARRLLHEIVFECEEPPKRE